MSSKNKHWKLSKETRKRMSESAKKRFAIKEKHPKGMLGKKHSEESRKKISETNKLLGRQPPHYHGEKSGKWKGGITPINKAIRNSLEMKLWRRAVFERDNYTCIWCGVKSGNGKAVILNADHVKPFAHYPELRFAIDNGRTLCIDCHKKTDTYAGKSK